MFNNLAFLSILTDKYSLRKFDVDYSSEMSSVLVRELSPSQPLFDLVSVGERSLRDETQ